MIHILSGIVVALSASPAISLLAKGTLVVAVGLVSSWFARRSRAAVRHALLASTFSVLLALPIISLVATPVPITVPVSKGDSDIWPLFDYISVPSPDTSTAVRFGAPPAKSEWTPYSLSAMALSLLLLGWCLGTALFVVQIMRGLLQIRSLRRFGLPWRHGQLLAKALAPGAKCRVEVLRHESLPGPVTCGVLNHLIILPADAQSWEEQDLQRALVHEMEHVRRNDWAIHCLARVACAVYWFHPLIWAAWRQLTLAAERSCDDAVLRNSEATAYADQLVGLARRRKLSAVHKSPALAMANRSDLSLRVGAVLDIRQQRGRAGALLVTLTCSVAVLVALTMSPIRMVAAPQASPAGSSGLLPSFDVASIKIAPPTEPGLVETHFASDTLTLKRVILTIPVMVAYGLQSFQVSGPDNLLRETRYDIVAKAPSPVPESQLRLMLRTLLSDRFHLTFHWEKKEMSVLALIVTRGGVKFHATAPGTDVNMSGRTLNGFSDVGYQYSQGQDGRAHRVLTNASMAAVAQLLGGNCVGGDGHTPVVDMTRTPGRFDLSFTDPPRSAFDDPPTGDYKLAACRAMMQDDLGLTFERRKAPVDVLVVDHAETTPTPN